MNATPMRMQERVVLSTVPVKVEGAQILSHQTLLQASKDNPFVEVYLLWPEERQLMMDLGDVQKIYVLGDSSDKKAVQEALRYGAEDFLERNSLMEVRKAPEEYQKKEQVIRLTPNVSGPTNNVPVKQPAAVQPQFQVPVFEQIMIPKLEEKTQSPKPIAEETLNYARLDEMHKAVSSQGRQTIAVSSTKGGVGKTTITLNLAKSLVDGKAGRVIVVDFMHPHGNVSTRLMMQRAVSVKKWESYQEMGGNLSDKVILTELVAKHPNGLYVLPGVGVGESITQELADFILTSLERTFDYVIIDVGPERQDIFTAVMNHATKTYLVVDYDFATVIDMQEYIQTWNKRNLMIDKLNIIVNFVPQKKEKNKLSKSLIEFYFEGIPIVTYLPETSGMRGIHNEGKVIIEHDKKCPFSLEMNKFVTGIVPGIEKDKGNKGFFSKFFK